MTFGNILNVSSFVGDIGNLISLLYSSAVHALIHTLMLKIQDRKTENRNKSITFFIDFSIKIFIEIVFYIFNIHWYFMYSFFLISTLIITFL